MRVIDMPVISYKSANHGHVPQGHFKRVPIFCPAQKMKQKLFPISCAPGLFLAIGPNLRPQVHFSGKDRLGCFVLRCAIQYGSNWLI